MKTLAILLLVILPGCTVIKTPGVTYISILQTKTLAAEWADDAGHERKLNYNTDGDKTIEALTQFLLSKGGVP